MPTKSFLELQKSFKESLKKSFKSKNIEIIKKDYTNINAPENDRKAALDQTFRDELMHLMIAGNSSAIEDFIAFSIKACREEIVTITMPVVLLGDVFDVVTLDQCEVLFTYVEKNVAIWKEDSFFSSCKNNLLRMCNDLLRRLSRSQNTVFCGRILLFLAKFFPFSERSGLNIVSEFNLENLTEFTKDNQEMVEVLENTEDSKLQIDYNLYCKFWALQDFFRNPNQCYTKQWKIFSNHATSVLAAFNSFKLEEPRSSPIKSNNTSTNDQEMMDFSLEDAKDSQHFFAKFLTNPKLLSLQLSDSNFRRSVLVQFLILFQYLSSTVKFKADSQNLTTAQTEWITETEAQVYKLLEETPPHGKKFAKTVRHMLQREELWNNWKNDGCKEFKRPESQIDDTPKPAKRQKRHLGDLIKDADKQGKFYMGNPELTRLWNLCPDNLQACKGSDRNFLPSLESYLENPKEKADPSFEWRALRLLARQSPHFFTLFNSPSYKVSDYLDSVRKKIQKDRTEIKEEVTQLEQIESEDVFTEEQMEADLLLKTEELKTEELAPEDKNKHRPAMITPEQLELLCPIIGNDWKKLATKLGNSADEILFFESEHSTVAEQCRRMLKLYFDDDMDANLDNLAYIMEGLDMIAATEATKKFISTDEKVEDIVSD